MIECLTDLVQFFILVSVILQLIFIVEHLFGQLFDLDLIVCSIEELSFCFFEFHPQQLDLIRETFNLNGLENDDEAHVFSEVAFLIVGQVLDAGPEWQILYLRRSSP